MNGSSFWVTLVLTSIPALASVGAAVVAGLSAKGARRSDAEAQHARDLEARISERKYEIYKPMINMLRDALSAGKNPNKNEKDITTKMADFATWIGIYGSDEAVQAFHNFMQATYSNAPPPVFLRLYGDFLLAARRDMGYSHTKIDRERLLGMRINNIYDSPDVIDPSAEEVYERLGWQPPWLSTNVVPSERQVRDTPIIRP